MKLTVTCPHNHCGEDHDHVVRQDEDELHLTCKECGWPILVVADDGEWMHDRGHWGPAGDDRVFHGLVCDLFHAELGALNVGPDCYSGAFDGVDYDHVEAKCHADPVGRALVTEVMMKYGGDDVALAIVAGEAGFRDGAITHAMKYDVHLFEIRRTKTSYRPVRIA